MEIETIMIQDFTKICRICLKLGELYPLQNYLNVLKIIINIEDSSFYELPQNICVNCVQFLDNLDKFIKTFLNSEIQLQRIIGENICKIEQNEIYDYDDRQSSDDEKNSKEVLCKNKPQHLELEQKRCVKNKEKIIKQNCIKKRIEECTCNICGNKFTRLGGLKRHMKIHMGIKPHICKICGKCFAEKATLSRHNLIHSDKKPYKCSLCGKESRRRDQTVDHIQKQHSNVTDFNLHIIEREKPNIEENFIANDITTNEDTIKFCETSETKNKSKKRLEICLCNLCGKIFKRREYLKNHMAVHAKVKPFKCNVCGKTFTQRHVLTRHNLVHTKERPYQCNLCGKTFNRKDILTEHITNHDGNKPHLCFHCGKCFTNKYYLTKHLKYYLTGKDNKNTGNKKCNCPHCGKELHSVAYLKTHLLIHTGEKPFECNICGQKFTTQQRLNNHLNIHKGIKPYTCTHCEKSFRTSNSLQKHLLLHTSERPYKCTSCDKGFIRRSHLKRHFRTH